MCYCVVDCEGELVVGMCYCVVHCKSKDGLVVSVCYCVVQVMGRCFCFLVKDSEDFCHVDVDGEYFDVHFLMLSFCCCMFMS